MADPTLVEDRAPEGSVVRTPGPVGKVFERIRKSLSFVCCWPRYRLIGGRRGTDGVVDFVLGNHFFKAYQVPSELRALAEIVSNLCPERAMEIGTAAGGTLFLLCKLASSTATIVSIDLPGGKFGGGFRPWRGWAYRKFARREQQLYLLPGDSHSRDMLARVKTVFGEHALDYLFIDGDHTYEGVKKDLECYAPMVRRGGVIVLHDIVEHPPATGCEVSKYWNQVKSQYRHTEIIESRGQGWAGIGVLYVD
jgi:predicted O-methyltransferase YrrM